jgi:Ca2+-binding EF-hand superfamily protein
MGAIGSRAITDEEAQAAFDEIDVNKDGSVSSTELKVYS